jgi:cytochrome c553
MRILMAAASFVVLAGCSQGASTPESVLAHGEYIVTSVGMCGDCHTPRLANGATDPTRALHGAPLPGPPHFAQVAPPLAGIPAHFTEEQFVTFLQTGARPDGTHPREPMPAYRLNEQDARSVAAYIATLPAAPAAAPSTP